MPIWARHGREGKATTGKDTGVAMGIFLSLGRKARSPRGWNTERVSGVCLPGATPTTIPCKASIGWVDTDGDTDGWGQDRLRQKLRQHRCGSGRPHQVYPESPLGHTTRSKKNSSNAARKLRCDDNLLLHTPRETADNLPSTGWMGQPGPSATFVQMLSDV